jgi:hypothetical protein
MLRALRGAQSAMPAVEKRLANERCAAPRQAQPPARREKEVKFTLSLLNGVIGVQGAENVGSKFTQKMLSVRTVSSQ